MESLKALVKIKNQEEARQMIRTGVKAVKSLEIVKKQFQDWKLKYSNVVPTSELTNKLELEEKLKEAKKIGNLKMKRFYTWRSQWREHNSYGNALLYVGNSPPLY